MHHTMVPSDSVEHATVYGRDGTKLGTIERLMLDKLSGMVAYVVIKTGGLLGSHHHYPVMWGALRYDPKRQAYETDLTPEDLRRPVAILPAPTVLDGLERSFATALASAR
jgi:sporulation protein YlmC with PRC-barrel domain